MNNNLLLVFVILYLIGTLMIGVWAGSRIKNTSDFATAGHSLPLIMVITTTFATWFGAETVMGLPAKFIQSGLHSIVEDPFGAGMCLVLVGLFFAMRLYKMNLLAIGDFYRQRYGTIVEIFCSIAIIISYLGWVAAQITALGVVFNIITDSGISETMGMILGTATVLIYVTIGGFLAVAWTDFIQMIILVIGLGIIAIFSSHLVGGPAKVIALANSKNLWDLWPKATFRDIAFFIAAAITMMLGSIPQQDVFQRVMSAKDANTARKGAIIGGIGYILFSSIPIFIVCCALIVMGDKALDIARNDYQRLLPTYIMNYTPFLMQVLFFGALLSAIKSTSSATLLAPSTSFVENILRHICPKLTDRQLLIAMRVTILIFSILVLIYAIYMRGTSIYDLVSAAYQITLVAAFVPLVFGLYWQRATTQGAILSILLGAGIWLSSLPILFDWGNDQFPGQLAGLIGAICGMIIGSLMPQWISDRHEQNTLPT